MSGLDVMHSFAESRSHDREVIRDGVTYRTARDVVWEFEALRTAAWLSAWEAIGAVAARDLLLNELNRAAQATDDVAIDEAIGAWFGVMSVEGGGVDDSLSPYDEFITAMAAECSCCDRCSVVPCHGITSGSLCDDMCGCDEDPWLDEEPDHG